MAQYLGTDPQYLGQTVLYTYSHHPEYWALKLLLRYQVGGAIVSPGPRPPSLPRPPSTPPTIPPLPTIPPSPTAPAPPTIPACPPSFRCGVT